MATDASRRPILTDIEGTTSSISFVKDVLFPYARRALPAFVREHGNEPAVRAWLDRAATDAGGLCDDAMLVEVLQGWIDEDRKHPALKALQGMLWDDGYASGEFTAHVYPDALAALRRWHADGHPLYVYSSGSVPAQKLLFGHTGAGDLRPLFSGWFDTAVGGKRDAASYRVIAGELSLDPSALLFLSDVVEELDAAREACHGHRRVESFADVAP
jgi:enolase-phosphatase E1